MTAIWAYPWDLYSEGVARTCEDLSSRGIEALNVAAHYHSVRSMNPRTPDALFEQFPGGAYFASDSSRFKDTPIKPIPNQVAGVEDPLLGIVDTAAEHDLSVNAWVVCLHNSRLGAENPEYRSESAFGDPQEHSLCPSYPAVREYYSAVLESVAARGVAEIQLESIGFPSVFHGHGWQFGHDKWHVLTSLPEKVLLSQCFCEGCRARAESHHVDFEAARRRVQKLVEQRLEFPLSDSLELDALVQEEALLAALFDFRSSVIEEFVKALATASGDVPLNYYVMEWTGSMPGDVWPTGVDIARIERYLGRVTALCYDADPDVVSRRIRAVKRSVSCPVAAGVTLDPGVIETQDQFNAVVRRTREEDAENCLIYHHGLISETQLDWINEIPVKES